jgi:hypothetical protein
LEVDDVTYKVVIYFAADYKVLWSIHNILCLSSVRQITLFNALTVYAACAGFECCKFQLCLHLV